MDYFTIDIANDEERLLNISELFAALGEVAGKRKEKGKRYTIQILLIVVILAKVCRENTPHGIAEWAKMRGQELQHLFNYHRRVIPSNKTLQRLTDTIVEDGNLQATIRQYLHRTSGGQQSVLITIDGKTLKRTIPKGETQGVHLLAAYLPEEGGFCCRLKRAKKRTRLSLPRNYCGS